jgi:hypothetical protein
MLSKVEGPGRRQNSRPAQPNRRAPVPSSAAKKPQILQHTGETTGCLVLSCMSLCIAMPAADTDVTHLAYDLQSVLTETGSASGLLLLPAAMAEAVPGPRLDEWAALAMGVMPSTSAGTPEAMATEARQLLAQHAEAVAASWQAYPAPLPPALR